MVLMHVNSNLLVSLAHVAQLESSNTNLPPRAYGIICSSKSFSREPQYIHSPGLAYLCGFCCGKSPLRGGALFCSMCTSDWKSISGDSILHFRFSLSPLANRLFSAAMSCQQIVLTCRENLHRLKAGHYSICPRPAALHDEGNGAQLLAQSSPWQILPLSVIAVNCCILSPEIA